ALVAVQDFAGPHVTDQIAFIEADRMLERRLKYELVHFGTQETFHPLTETRKYQAPHAACAHPGRPSGEIHIEFASLDLDRPFAVDRRMVDTPIRQPDIGYPAFRHQTPEFQRRHVLDHLVGERTASIDMKHRAVSRLHVTGPHRPAQTFYSNARGVVPRISSRNCRISVSSCHGA